MRIERKEKLICLEGLMDRYYLKLVLKAHQRLSKLIVEEWIYEERAVYASHRLKEHVVYGR